MQIGAHGKGMISSSWLVNKYRLKEPVYEDQHKGYYIYTVGRFNSAREAQDYKSKLRREHNIYSSFVVRFVNGKRDDAISIIKPADSRKQSIVKPTRTTIIKPSVQKKQPIIRNNQSLRNEIEYRVQLKASKSQLKISGIKDEYQIRGRVFENFYNGRYIYTIGSFATRAEADAYNKQLRKSNQISGFVVAFKNGERIGTTKTVAPSTSIQKRPTIIKPASIKKPEALINNNLEYRVQIAANLGRRLSMVELVNLYGLTWKLQENYVDGYYIYTVGSFKNANEAGILRDELRNQNNIKGAFVVTFKNGERYKK